MNIALGSVPDQGHAATLASKGILAGYLLVCVAIIAAAFFAFSKYRDGVEQATEGDLVAFTHFKKFMLEETLRIHMADARMFATRQAVWRVLDPASTPVAPAQQALEHLVEQTKAGYGYWRIFVFDPKLKPVYPAGTTAIPAAVSAALAAATRTREPAIVDIHRNSRGETTFGVASPVFANGDRAGAVAGTVFLEVDLRQALLSIVDSWPTSPSSTGETMLVRREGADILYLTPMRKHPGEPALTIRRPASDSTLFASAALTATSGAILGKLDYTGSPVIGATSRIAGTSWILVSKIDAAEATREILALAWVTSALAAVFIFLTGAIAYLLWKNRQAATYSRNAR